MARRKLDSVFAKAETLKEDEETIPVSNGDGIDEIVKPRKKEKPKGTVKVKHARVGVYLPSQEVARAVKRLATEEDKRPNTLYLEALVLLFKNRGLPLPKELKDFVE